MLVNNHNNYIPLEEQGERQTGVFQRGRKVQWAYSRTQKDEQGIAEIK
jgi:hypothetical protein